MHKIGVVGSCYLKLTTQYSKCFQTKEVKDELQPLNVALPRFNELVKCESGVLVLSIDFPLFHKIQFNTTHHI